MRVIAAVLAVSALLACSAERAPSTEGPRGVALVPDTQTVDGVLEMRHSADALERAPQWTLDPVPMVVIDGGDAIDLSYTIRPVPLSDGSFAMLAFGGGARLVLFDETGRPGRVLATPGQGPGELWAARHLVRLGGDTLFVADDATARSSWFLPAQGLLFSSSLVVEGRGSCFRGSGRLASGRLIGIGDCLNSQRNSDGTARDTTPLLSVTPGYDEIDTLALIRGYRMGVIEVRQGGRKYDIQQQLVFGQITTVTAFDSTIVLATGENGYVIELMSPEGRLTGRISVDVPRRPVTDEMRQFIVDRRLTDLATRQGNERMAITMEEARRQIIEAPAADTLPVYDDVLPGEDGLFWVTDYILGSDSTWSSSAFLLDGTIVGRVTGRRSRENGRSGPVWFGRDRVMVREVDDDGVVRFGVYRIRGT